MSVSVVISGIGAASALGTGIEAHRAALWKGEDGLRPITRFDTSRLATRLGATWPGWDGRVQPETGPDGDLAATASDFPLHELALVAAREAWSGAKLPAIDPRRVVLVFGTCFGHGFAEFHEVTERIAAALGIGGPCITISTACASSTNAIGLGRDLLARGYADVVLAGGADSLLREACAGFSALGVLSGEKCAPFSEPTGTTLGEGGAFVVLERGGDVERRGVAPWASVHGYGLSADGFHETTPDPTGAGVERAIAAALDDAGWSNDAVDYVSAHATGTANNDRIEWSVVERLFGRHGRTPAVSGSKGQLGHTQGAAGALELVLALLCQREGAVPATLHFRGARTGCPRDPVAASLPRNHPVARALKLSAAFGGANAVLAYGAPDLAPSHEPRARSPVVVRGVGVVGPTGAHTSLRLETLRRSRAVGPCGEVDLGRIGVDPRRLDRSARWLTAAAALALGDGGRPLREAASVRTGLFVGATRMPPESSKRCRDAIGRHGVAAASAAAFARMSVNAPAGACSRSLGILGPTTTLSTGAGSGLLAAVLAADWLATRSDADRIVAGAVDERRGAPDDEAEGAACIVFARDRRPGVIARGWGVAGPNDARGAVDQALERCERSVDGILVDADPRDSDPKYTASLQRLIAPGAPIGYVDASAWWGTADASRSCVMVAVAVAELEARAARCLLVIAAGGSSSVALLLERSDS